MIIHQQTIQIIAAAFANGITHDVRLFIESKTVMAHQVLCLADAGYQGLVDLHTNSRTPKKKSKHHPLTVEQKAANRELARKRIFVEHVIREVKIFRILSERYRNRLPLQLLQLIDQHLFVSLIQFRRLICGFFASLLKNHFPARL